MLNYTEKTQNIYIQSLTVSEIMSIENCGLTSSPRTIAVSWESLLRLRRANVAIYSAWSTIALLRVILYFNLVALCNSYVNYMLRTGINIT
jgi:hypothetical protein